MAVYPILAASLLVFLVWIIVANQKRLADTGFTRKFVVGVSILALGLQVSMFQTFLKFAAAGPPAPVVILLLAGSFCSSVVLVELVRVVSPSERLWATRKYWYFVLAFSVLLAVISMVTIFLLRGSSV